MALQLNFELDGVIYQDAYLRIHKIRTAMVEYEKFVTVEDDPFTDQILDWDIRCETSATAYVWIDKSARDNRAQPMKWFSFEFEYDINSPENIYTQAYNALKTAKEFTEAINV